MRSSSTAALSQRHARSLHAAGAMTQEGEVAWARYHFQTAVPQTQVLYMPVSAPAPTSWSLAGSVWLAHV